MGTHYYTTTIVKKRIDASPPNIEDLSFSLVDKKATNNFTLVEGMNSVYDIYLTQNGCREALTNNIRGVVNMLSSSTNQFNYLMGVRCFGDQYNTVVKLLRKQKDSTNILSQVISNIVTMPVQIDKGYVPSTKWAKYGRGAMERTLRNDKGRLVTYQTRGYVTIYVKFWEKRVKYLTSGSISLRMSTIAALLREPIFCEKAIRGEISTFEDAVKILAEISKQRLNKKDLSYYPIVVLGQSAKLFSRNESNDAILNHLATSGNSDGSDWFSILKLSMFIHHVNPGKNLPSIGYTTANGPSSYITEEWGRSDIRKFAIKYLDTEFRASIRDHLWAGSEMSYGLRP